MATETRVRWSPAEKRLLIDEAKRAIEAQPMRYMEALSAAQAQLPRERRRNVPGAWDVPWFVDGLGSAGAAAHASAIANGTLRRAKSVAGAPGMAGLREQLVIFFTDVLVESLARAERQVARAKGGAAVPTRAPSDLPKKQAARRKAKGAPAQGKSKKAPR